MKHLKLLTLCFSILFLNTCGYKNLNSDKLKNYKIVQLEIKGDEKLVYKLKNNIEIYSDPNSMLAYNIKVNLITYKESKIKNTAGKTTRYSKILQAKVLVTNTNNQNEYNKTFSSSNDYDIGSVHSDTLNNEKNAAENNLNYISNEIIKYLKLLNLK
jgi:hypothetical protein